jgi:hypothetical protein
VRAFPPRIGWCWLPSIASAAVFRLASAIAAVVAAVGAIIPRTVPFADMLLGGSISLLLLAVVFLLLTVLLLRFLVASLLVMLLKLTLLLLLLVTLVRGPRAATMRRKLHYLLSYAVHELVGYLFARVVSL